MIKVKKKKNTDDNFFEEKQTYQILVRSKGNHHWRLHDVSKLALLSNGWRAQFITIIVIMFIDILLR